MARPRKPPTYLRHVGPDGIARARTRIDGKDYWLGDYGTKESQERFRDLCAGRGTATVGLTVRQLVRDHLQHAQRHYRDQDGDATSELEGYASSTGLLVEMFGDEFAASFSPKRLKALRERMVAKGWCRKTVNQRVGRIKRIFKWAASEELVPVAAYQGLLTVAGLQAGRSDAGDNPPVAPVDAEVVAKTIAAMRPVHRAMVLVQLLVGCRPGEVCSMRKDEIDRAGPIVAGVQLWLYRPRKHKTAWRGHKKQVVIGPKAQAILLPWLDKPGPYVFSPRFSRANAGERFRVGAYGQLVRKVCKRRGIPAWSPNQLRHSAATTIQEQFSLDDARAVLSHKDAQTTAIYAAADLARAANVAAKIG